MIDRYFHEWASLTIPLFEIYSEEHTYTELCRVPGYCDVDWAACWKSTNMLVFYRARKASSMDLSQGPSIIYSAPKNTCIMVA